MPHVPVSAERAGIRVDMLARFPAQLPRPRISPVDIVLCLLFAAPSPLASFAGHSLSCPSPLSSPQGGEEVCNSDRVSQPADRDRLRCAPRLIRGVGMLQLPVRANFMAQLLTTKTNNRSLKERSNCQGHPSSVFCNAASNKRRIFYNACNFYIVLWFWSSLSCLRCKSFQPGRSSGTLRAPDRRVHPALRGCRISSLTIVEHSSNPEYSEHYDVDQYCYFHFTLLNSLILQRLMNGAVRSGTA